MCKRIEGLFCFGLALSYSTTCSGGIWNAQYVYSSGLLRSIAWQQHYEALFEYSQYSNNRSLVEKAVGGRAGDLSDPITGPTSDRRDMYCNTVQYCTRLQPECKLSWYKPARYYSSQRILFGRFQSKYLEKMGFFRLTNSLCVSFNGPRTT